jgi:hypothetical protein
MAKKQNKASQSEGSKRKKTTSSQASASAKKAGTDTSASSAESGAGTSAAAGGALYSTGGNQNAGSAQGSQDSWQSAQEQQTPWNSGSGYGNMGAQQQQQQGGGMGYPGNDTRFSSPQGQWNEDRNQGHQAGQYQQQQEHWDKSYDSLKHHGLEGNRNAPDWERSQAGNRGENQYSQHWEGQQAGGQPGDWNQQADWNRGAGNASWQGEQRDYQGGGVYHSGGEYRQQQQQYSGYGQGSGQGNQHWQEPANRREEENRRGYGAGSYAGELNRDRGRGGYEGDYYTNSGYSQFYEMGGYDRDHSRDEERRGGPYRGQGYASGPGGGTNRNERQDRPNPFGRGYDQDSHFSAGGISSMGGDYDREGSRGRQYRANYDSAGNFIGSYDSREGMQDSREWRQDSDRRGSHYDSRFGAGRNQQGNRGYEGQRRDSGWGSERGYDQYQNAYPQRQDPWGTPGRGDSESRYRGYPSDQSPYAGSGSYGGGNRYGRSDSYDSDRNRARSAGYERDQDENRRRGPKRFNTGDDAYDYRDYGASHQEYNRYRGHQEEEGFLDKAADRVRSWFGGREEDQHRR